MRMMTKKVIRMVRNVFNPTITVKRVMDAYGCMWIVDETPNGMKCTDFCNENSVQFPPWNQRTWESVKVKLMKAGYTVIEH